MSLEAVPPLELAYDAKAGVTDAELWRRLRRAPDQESFAAAWLALQGRQIGGVRAGVVILGESERGPFTPAATLPGDAPIGADLSIAAETALSERKGVVREGSPRDRSGTHCIAFPVLVDDRLNGAVAIEIEARPQEAVTQAARALQWGSAWIEAMVRRRSLLPSRQLAEALDMVATVMEAPRLSVALRGLTGELANLIETDWVAIGLVDWRGHIDLKALSQATKIAKKIELSRAIAAAMQEALDQREIILVPEPPGAGPVVTRAHVEMIETFGAGSLASVPVTRDGEIIGVITARRGLAGEFSGAEVAFLRLLGTVIGPAIDLKRKDDRWITTKLGVAIGSLTKKLIGPAHPVLKLAVLATVLIGAYASIGTATYRISAPATLEGSQQRAITAPIQGFIAAAGARAGDTVAAGDLLARLDDRDLTLERARLQSEREEYLREYRQAFASVDRTRVQVLRARIDETQARLDLIAEQLARIEIRAPFAGVVLRGDLSQALGSPVQRGDVLFELAPAGDFRVVVKVDERDIADVRPGQTGTLVLASAPSVSWPLTIQRVTPVSVAEEGRNAFRVEAMLTGPGAAVKPGMQGFAKIEIDERNVTTIATRRLINWFDLFVWRWRP